MQNYTVARLREIATRMEIKSTTKTRKPELIAAISAGVDETHMAGLIENTQRVKAEPFVPPFVCTVKMSNKRRVHNYRKQNGTSKLTPAQRRRIAKNERSPA